jgi:tRNA threonylcarbamoyladenosine biosynthesis protein TsaE
MQYSFSLNLQSETDTQNLAQVVASCFKSGVIYLIGDLGAGKTTLTRFLLQSLGHQGAVKSPTYTLVEPYSIAGQEIFHFDLYRLNDPYELELMGIRDYLETPDALFLFEWPSKGGDEIPQADLVIQIEKSIDETTRIVTVQTSLESLHQTLEQKLGHA